MAKELDELLKPLKEVNIGDLFVRLNKKAIRHNKKLRARAKNQEKLTVGLECTVLEVNSYQASTSFTPRSELVLGGTSPSYGGGHTYQTEIKVESGTLVEKLQFNGWPHLETGDQIRAYILKGQPEYEKQVMGNGTFGNEKSHWVEREYEATEKPSKIEKLRDGKVVATYHNK